MSRLSELSVSDLESVLSKYPWFALAHKELYLRTALMGEEYRKLGIKRAGVYVSSREKLAIEGFRHADSGADLRLDFDSRNDINKDRQAVRIIGGDWFSQEDLKSIETSPGEEMKSFGYVAVTDTTIPPISDELFYTETLARIYGEQELHQMAIDVYEKLILIYPEKSAYFAALIEEQKKHL